MSSQQRRLQLPVAAQLSMLSLPRGTRAAPWVEALLQTATLCHAALKKAEVRNQRASPAGPN